VALLREDLGKSLNLLHASFTLVCEATIPPASSDAGGSFYELIPAARVHIHFMQRALQRNESRFAALLSFEKFPFVALNRDSQFV
jgi:hypothetical protein